MFKSSSLNSSCGDGHCFYSSNPALCNSFYYLPVTCLTSPFTETEASTCKKQKQNTTETKRQSQKENALNAVRHVPLGLLCCGDIWTPQLLSHWWKVYPPSTAEASEWKYALGMRRMYFFR